MNLFVYGTLTEKDRMMRLLDVSEEYLGEAVESHVTGCTKYDESATRLPYPVVLLEDSGRVNGVMWRNLTLWDLQQLDHYEGVASGLYVRIQVGVTVREAGRFNKKQTMKAWMYVGTDERWGHVKTSPHARLDSKIGKFHGFLPRWIHEAMDEGALRVDATGVYSDTAESWMLLSTKSGRIYRIETSRGDTKIIEMLDETHTEITSAQFVRIFDHN